MFRMAEKDYDEKMTKIFQQYETESSRNVYLGIQRIDRETELEKVKNNLE